MIVNPTTVSHSISMGRIRRFLARSYKSRFARNVVIVASGTAGAQAITMAFSPIITRMYGPEAFGLLGVFLAMLGVLSTIGSLTYPTAIVLPKSDHEAVGIARLATYIAFAFALLITVIIYVGGEQLLRSLDAQEVYRFALLIPLATLFISLSQIGVQWLIRKKQFSISARIGVLQALLVNSTKVGVGWFYPWAAILIVLSTLGHAIHAVMLALAIQWSRSPVNQDPPAKETQTNLWYLAKKYYDFPLYRAPQVLINSVSHNLPLLMLATFFGPVPAGFYAICQRVMAMPSQLIGNSLGAVFYPKITETAHRGQDPTKLILRATVLLAAVGLPPFVLLIAFGPWLFGFVFGVEWVVAGEYARWMSVMMFFFFINKPSVVAIPVLGLQKGLLIYELLSTGLKILSIYLGAILFSDDTLAIALFSLCGALAYIVLIAWVIISSHSIHRRTVDGEKTS